MADFHPLFSYLTISAASNKEEDKNKKQRWSKKFWFRKISLPKRYRPSFIIPLHFLPLPHTSTILPKNAKNPSAKHFSLPLPPVKSKEKMLFYLISTRTPTPPQPPTRPLPKQSLPLLPHRASKHARRMQKLFPLLLRDLRLTRPTMTSKASLAA